MFLYTVSQYLFISSCLAFRFGTPQELVLQNLDVFESANKSCPPWKFDKYHNSSCECGDSLHNLVRCMNDESVVSLMSCHCMSYSDHDGTLLVGASLYLCTNNFYTEISDHTNLNHLCNSVMQQDREGQMCGRCIDNYSPSPYSYRLKCAQCFDYRYNWIRYLLIAYLPLTAFFIVVIFFQFNAMSPSMNAFLIFCQIMSSPAVMGLLMSYVNFSNKSLVDLHIDLTISEKVLSTIYGFWNLDFFRMVYTPFCLHPSMSILQILSLDYAIAVYPLLLVFLTYLIVKLHDKFKIVQILWKPVAWLFRCFNHEWRTSSSLVKAFGTFFLLSYLKIINTSFDILMPVQLYNVSGQVVGLYSYYNGSLEYFGQEHLPYGLLAIFTFVTFNLVPLLLLCLYPSRCFQSRLNFCQLNSQVLRTFMDAFQGCNKF